MYISARTVILLQVFFILGTSIGVFDDQIGRYLFGTLTINIGIAFIGSVVWDSLRDERDDWARIPLDQKFREGKAIYIFTFVSTLIGFFGTTFPGTTQLVCTGISISVQIYTLFWTLIHIHI